MEFCPKCGKLLTPSTISDGTLALMCRLCSYTMPIPSSERSYTWTERIDLSKRRGATIVEVPPTVKKQRKEERELAQEYYEVFLESFREEGGEEEGGD